MLFRPTQITINTSDVFIPVLDSYILPVMEEDTQSSDDNYPQDNSNDNDTSNNNSNNDNKSDANKDKPKEDNKTSDNNNDDKDDSKKKDKGFFEKILDAIKAFFNKILSFFKKAPDSVDEVKNNLPEKITLKINNEESGKKTVGYVTLLTENYNKLDEYVINVQKVSALCNRIRSTTENNDLSGLHDEYKELSNRYNEFQEFFKNDIMGKIQTDKEYSFPSDKVQTNLTNIIQKYEQAIQGNGEVDFSQSLSNEEEPTERDKLLTDILTLYKNYGQFMFGLSEQVLSLLTRAANGNGNDSPKNNGTSEEDAFLLKEGKVDGNVDGYNTVAVTNNKFPYAKQNANKEMQEKFGVRIIVVDRNIFNKLKSDTKRFALKHEVGHIKQYEKNEDKGRPIEVQEGEADIFAVKALGWNKKKLKKAFNDITAVAAKSDIKEDPEAIKAQFARRLEYISKKLGL